MSHKRVLTIAGTDPTGSAGITADLGVFRDFGCLGASVITSVVWQNSQGVQGFKTLEVEEVLGQLDAVLDDLKIDAVKIGMLGNAEIAAGVASRLKRLSVPIVLDPVMASGDGARAMWLSGGEPSGWEPILDVATLITPNVPEFLVLTGREALEQEEIEAALRQAVSGFDTDVLLKSGHLPSSSSEVADFLMLRGQSQVQTLTAFPRIPDDVRGTGCALSSAIAASLVSNQDVLASVELAREYLSGRLAARYWPGKGRASLGPHTKEVAL